MDSLTQLTLGAAVGEACIGRKAGHKAWIWGGILGTLPDLDILAAPFMDLVEFTRFHRGPTHSVLILLPVSLLLAQLFPRIHPSTPLKKSEWSLFAALVLITHPLLDCFTTWGTQLFWPFELTIAWNSIFVIDPLYTLPLLVLLILAIIHRRREKKRKNFVRAGLLVSSLYLGLTLLNKGLMEDEFERSLEKEDREVLELQTKPTPFNNLLWSAIAQTPNGYLIGYRSFLAPSKSPEFRFIPKNEELLGDLRDHPKVQGLIRISQGWFAVEREKKEPEEGKEDRTLLRFHDLRFGEVFFWDRERTRPSFTYFIEEGANGELTVRRDMSSYDVERRDFRAFGKMVVSGKPSGGG